MNIARWLEKRVLPESPMVTYASAALLLVVMGIYAWLFGISAAGILPVNSDEAFYFVNTKSYVENSTLRAALTYTGKGSILFGADGHGFAYPLFHGIVARVFGFHPLSLPFTNGALLICALIPVLLIRKFPLSRKLFLSICILAYPATILHACTFMQESLHLLIGVVCSLLLCKTYADGGKRWMIAFVAVVLIASLFRNLWLFWTIGLLPLAKSRRMLVRYAVVFFFSAALSFLSAKLLWDPFPSFAFGVTSRLFSGDVIGAAGSVLGHFRYNMQMFTRWPHRLQGMIPFGMNMFLVFILGTWIASFLRTRSRLLLSACLIGMVNVGLLFFAFDAWGWREIRSMAPLFILFAFVTVYRSMILPGAVTLLFLTVSLVPATMLARIRVGERVQMAQVVASEQEQTREYGEIAHVVAHLHDPLIYLPWWPPDHHPHLLIFPVTSTSGRPIRYAVNYFEQKVNMEDYDYVLYIWPPEDVPAPATPVLTGNHVWLHEAKGYP